MRLIDVSDLEKFIQENVCVIGNDHLLLVAGDDGRWHEALPLVKTAYSVDRVVEELSNADPQEMMSEEQRNVLNYAIEIVKQGGVGKDVEQMRADGIVRRFDDFGRIVIPKELRKQLFGTPEKSEGMPMEIFMDKDEIILRKYVENKSDDVCEWKQTSTAKYKTSCGYRLEEYFDTKACYCKQCGKKIKVVE